MKRLLVRAAGAALLSSLALGQVYPEPGVRTADLLDVGDGAYASLSDGGYVSFDGLAFERYDAAGGLVQTYGTVPSPVFPSFVVVDASETAAYVGESSNGDVFTIDLVVGDVTALSNISFNYNMAFDATPGLAYVSAALGGFGTGNSVLRLDLAVVAVGERTPLGVEGLLELDHRVVRGGEGLARHRSVEDCHLRVVNNRVAYLDLVPLVPQVYQIQYLWYHKCTRCWDISGTLEVPKVPQVYQYFVQIKYF